jgi:DUF2946 family protein
MQIGLGKRTRTWTIGVLLIALMWRALIPPGFMPKSGGLLAVEICHAGFPTSSSHHHDGDNKGHVEHCLFASAAAAPLPHSSFATALIVPTELFRSADAQRHVPVQRVHIPEPRGPPRSS